MKCDKLLNDALNLHIDPESRAALNAMRKPAVSGYTPVKGAGGIGIDINSKLMTALKKIKESHTKSIDGDVMFREETIRKLLEREGVSKGEVNASLDAAFKFLKENGSTSADMDKISLDTIISAAHAKQPKIQDRTRDASGYASYTYNKQGLIPGQDYQVRHVLGFDKRVSQEHMPKVEGSYGWARQYIGRQPGIEDDVWRLDEVQSDLFQDTETVKGWNKKLGALGMNYVQLKKMLIVDALDQAIKHNLDKVVIPITRSANYLTGSTKVSEAYRDLNTGILPAIRRELDRAGLKLDIKHLKQANIPSGEEIERALMGNPSLKEDEDTWQELYGFFGADFPDTVTAKEFDDYIAYLKDKISTKDLNTIKEIKSELFNPEAFVITMSDKTGKPLKPEVKVPVSKVLDIGGLGEKLLNTFDNKRILTPKIQEYLEYKEKFSLEDILYRGKPENKEKITKAWEDIVGIQSGLPTTTERVKYRWDALSVLGGLGLAEAYNKLQKEES